MRSTAGRARCVPLPIAAARCPAPAGGPRLARRRLAPLSCSSACVVSRLLRRRFLSVIPLKLLDPCILTRPCLASLASGVGRLQRGADCVWDYHRIGRRPSPRRGPQARRARGAHTHAVLEEGSDCKRDSAEGGWGVGFVGVTAGDGGGSRAAPAALPARSMHHQRCLHVGHGHLLWGRV